jgi:ribosomal protein S18 acetylase RimI-like enzyme
MRRPTLWLTVLCLLASLAITPGDTLAQSATPSTIMHDRLQATPTGTPGATPVFLDDAKDIPSDAASLAALTARDDDGFRVSTGAIEVAILVAVVLAVIAGTTYTWRRPPPDPDPRRNRPWPRQPGRLHASHAGSRRVDPGTSAADPEMTMTIRIRPATPTPTDAAAFATLANMASHNILADFLGPGVEQVLATIFLDDSTLYRPRQVWFTTVGDTVAGMLCAFTGAEKATLNAATDRYFEEAPGHVAALARTQMEPLSAFIDTVPPGAFYIQFLAVEPAWRGQGHARALLAHAEDLARQRGAATLELDVETGNDAALAAYRRAGLEVIRSSRVVRYDAQRREIGFHRMARALA